MYVRQSWTGAGILKTESDETLAGFHWIDVERGVIGAGWTGSIFDNVRPFEQPFTGYAEVDIAGRVLTGSGQQFTVADEGRITFSAADNTVSLRVEEYVDYWSDPWTPEARSVDGHISDELVSESIRQNFEWREYYDPANPYFGVKGAKQRSTENDVVSGNAKGQFGGALTTFGGEEMVYGTAGLTEIQDYPGWSVILLFNSLNGIGMVRQPEDE